MKKSFSVTNLLPIYVVAFSVLLLLAHGGSKAVSVLTEKAPVLHRKVVVIDPGHGGVDGGATSCTGVLESNINLEISLRLNDLLHLLGSETVLIRDTDRSVYTQGTTIAQKKISDLKQRVKIVNEQEDALLVSIHQNHFTDGKYYGPQVFYSREEGSAELARAMQKALSENLCPESKRKAKTAEDVYLIKNINCTALLIECGFISNPEEEAKLRDADYQKELSCVIAAVCGNYLNRSSMS